MKWFACVEVEAFEDIGVEFENLFAGEAHFFIGIGMIAFEAERLFDGFVNENFESGFIGVTELFVERTQDLLGALDQIVVVEDQVAGGRMRVQILERMAIPMLSHIQDFVNIEPRLFGIGKLTTRVVDP